MTSNHQTYPLHAKYVVAGILFFSSTVAVADSIKVAFIGDQGVRGQSAEVLSLIANEGTDLLLIQGDLGYDDNTANTWNQRLDEALGSDFPVIVAIGNHENFEWPAYQRLINNRIDRIDGLNCSGNTGVKAKCSFGNIDVVHIAPGIYEVPGVSADDNYADFIDSSFSSSDNQWKICSWHKPHRKLQTSDRQGPDDWDIYDSCLDAGAMVALAHSHAYSRTFLLSDYPTQRIVHKGQDMALQPGQSFAFVSGLGGRDAVPQERSGDHFASIYTASQGAKAGALFCTFESTTADCYFKAIDGAVPDQFTLSRSGNNTSPPPARDDSGTSIDNSADSSSSTSPTGGYVFSRSDKQEYRWIAQNSEGELGSTWISESCANSLGGASASGNWSELLDQAPGFDTIQNPCINGGSSETPTAAPSQADGFAFSRTDTTEFRWIETNAAGELGSTWIDEDCAQRMGGVQSSGDWDALMALAPGFDTIAYPCF